MKAIEVVDLSKTYAGGVQALKNVSLSIEQGRFYGMLGPNGAGKSTFIGILCSLVNKTSGRVSIMGHDLDRELNQAKSFLGVVPQEFNFNIFETCLNIVTYQAGYYGVPAKLARQRGKALFEQLGLSDKMNTTAMELSGGMKRRLMIARALIHDPQILILDEPTAGVDIALRRTMWDFLQLRNQQGLTIILTTHYLEEAEHLCERIAIIDKGQLIEDAPTSEIIGKLDQESFILYLDSSQNFPSLSSYDVKVLDETSVEIKLSRGENLSALFEELKSKKVKVNRMKNKSNRLEESFLNLVEL